MELIVDKSDKLRLQIDSLHGLYAVYVDNVQRVKLCLYRGPKIFLPRHANYVARLIPGEVIYSTSSSTHDTKVWTIGGLVFLRNHLLRVITPISCRSIRELSVNHLKLINMDLQRQYKTCDDPYVQSIIGTTYQKINNKSIHRP